MNQQNNLGNFYQSKVYPQIEGLETQRKEIVSKLKKIQRFLMVSVVLTTAAVGNLTSTPANGAGVVMFSVIVLLPSYFIIAYKIKKPYHAVFKSRIVRPVVEAMGENVIYEPEESISTDTIVEAKIFKKISRSSGDDYVKGRFHSKQMEFSQIEASYRGSSRNSNGSRNENDISVLSGWMFIVDIDTFVQEGFAIETKGKIDIGAVFGSGVLGAMAKGVVGLANKLANEEDPLEVKTGEKAFDKKFQLRGNKADVDRFLTPEIRSYLLEMVLKPGEATPIDGLISQTPGQSIVLALRDRKLYFGIDSFIDFESRIKESLLDYKEPIQLMEYIKSAVTLAENFEENKEEMEMAW